MIILPLEREGTVYEIGVGESFDVAFTEAGAAGYLWVVEAGACVAIETSHYVPEMDAIGAFSKKHFEITGVEQGTTSVIFRHKRPWNDEECETYKIIVRVLA